MFIRFITKTSKLNFKNNSTYKEKKRAEIRNSYITQNMINWWEEKNSEIISLLSGFIKQNLYVGKY